MADNKKSIYIVEGENPYLIEQFKSKIEKELFSNAEEKELNRVTIDLRESPLSEVLNEAYSIPFFGENRLIYALHASFLSSEKKVADIEDEIAEMTRYLKEPVETSILVFFTDKLDGKKKIVKDLKKAATLIDATKYTTQLVKKEAGKRFAEANKRISGDVLEYLLNLTNEDITQTMSEVNKIILYLGERSEVTKDDVETLVSKSLENNLFDLTDLLLAGKVNEAMDLFHDLILSGESPIKLVSILSNQFRLLIQVKILSGEGQTQGNIVSTLGVSPYPVKLAMGKIRRFSSRQLSDLYLLAADLDFNMKTGKMNQNLLFELFLIEATNKLKKQ
jgi:DNA polymerase-3 subunit delta